MQNEYSPTSQSARAETSDSSSVSASSVVCSSAEANHASGLPETGLPETVQPHTAINPEICRLPDDIEDGLDDASDDVPLDVSNVSKEQLLQIHSKIAGQRDSYRKKCIQVC